MSGTGGAPVKRSRFAWVGQIRENYRMTQESDPRIGLILLGVFAGTLVVVFGLFFLLFRAWLPALILAIPFALLAAVYLFGRRAMGASYRQIEGQPGAAAAVVQAMRGGKWTITTAVAVSKSQDIVHRAVGRPGVVLIGEGVPSRVEHLLASEKKRTARFVGEIPVTELQVGTYEGQVPLGKLQGTLTKMTAVMTPAETNDLRRRLDALTSTPVPLPKGPLPKSARIPRGPRG